MLDTKYPFMVEFTGSPEAGKTTCIKTILERFSNEGLKVKYIQESAEIIANSNIPKGSFEGHLSMRLLTLLNIINSKYEDYDLMLIDRGLLDGIFYTTMFLTNNPDKYVECQNLINLLDVLKTAIAPDFLIIFKVEPKTAIERKGHEGSLVNLDFVGRFNNLLDSFQSSLSCSNIMIDTTHVSKEDVADNIFNLIKSKLEQTLD